MAFLPRKKTITPLAPRKWNVRKKDSRTQEKEVEAFCAGKMEENPVGWFINRL